jgi:hypothetical protein
LVLVDVSNWLRVACIRLVKEFSDCMKTNEGLLWPHTTSYNGYIKTH